MEYFFGLGRFEWNGLKMDLVGPKGENGYIVMAWFLCTII